MFLLDPDVQPLFVVGILFYVLILFPFLLPV